MAKHGKAWQSMAKHGKALQSMAKHGKAWQSMAKHGKTVCNSEKFKLMTDRQTQSQVQVLSCAFAAKKMMRICDLNKIVKVKYRIVHSCFMFKQ